MLFSFYPLLLLFLLKVQLGFQTLKLEATLSYWPLHSRTSTQQDKKNPREPSGGVWFGEGGETVTSATAATHDLLSLKATTENPLSAKTNVG